MEKEKYPFSNYVQMTVHLMHLSLMELVILYKERSAEEIKMVNSHLFQNYALSLQYMFTMEFVKLFERDSNSGKNVASLERWNKFLSHTYGVDFQERFESNRKILNEIRKSQLYKLILNNRNTKFAHLDSSTGNPYNVPALSGDAIKEAIEMLGKIRDILRNCTSVEDYEFAFWHADDRTDNFIRFHTNYQNFYHKHFQQAMEEGFY